MTDGRYIYALEQASIVRLDPGSGRETSVRYVGQSVALAISKDRYLFLLSFADVDNQVVLQRWSIPALKPAGTMTVRLPSMHGLGAAMTTSPDASRIYVGGGTSVVSIDPAQFRIRDRLTIAAPSVVGLSASPDGTLLYVATNPGGGSEGTITTYSLANDRAIRSQVGAVGLGEIVATSTGLWQLGGGGHVNIVVFASNSAPSRLIREPEGGGGGIFPTFTVTGAVAWIGGYGPSCVDPRTGKVRATASLVSRAGVPQAILTGMLSTADGSIYGEYTPLGTPLVGGIVRITPPTECLRPTR